MKGKKWRDVRNALVMVIVMVAMMSSATFAWFTMTSNPTVTGLEMVASAGSGISVCNTVDGTYVNAIEIALSKDNMNLDADEIAALAAGNPVERIRKLMPVSLSNNSGNPGAFRDPSYSPDGLVRGLDASDLTDLTGKVAVYTHYIRSESGNVKVGLKIGDPGTNAESGVNAANQATAAGSFVRGRKGSTDAANVEAIGAIRVGIIVTEDADSDGVLDNPVLTDLSKMIIYEPNEDFTVSGSTGITSANTNEYTATPVPSDVKSSTEGAVTYGGTGSDSNALFTVSETPKKVTVFVWLEGSDAHCVDQIKTDEMEAQIQFVGLGAADSSSNNLLN